MATSKTPPRKNAASKTKTTRTTRSYLPAPERERQIIQGAISFFAEKGFSGTTRDLAKSLGIANGLLFKYFPTKESLIEKVYVELFELRWHQNWETALHNRSIGLEDRLIDVYTNYTRVINSYEWVRVYLFGGLNGTQMSTRYWAYLRENLFRHVIDELRLKHGKPPISLVPPLEAEFELVWSLHASLFYLGVRKWVHMLDVPKDNTQSIRQIIQGFLDAAPRVLAKVDEQGASRKPKGAPKKAAA